MTPAWTTPDPIRRPRLVTPAAPIAVTRTAPIAGSDPPTRPRSVPPALDSRPVRTVAEARCLRPSCEPRRPAAGPLHRIVGGVVALRYSLGR